MVKFLRRSWDRYSKLGKGRKKKQVWRKPRGRDNKMREKRKGYPVVVSIGYKKSEKKIKERKPIVMNVQDLRKVKENKIVTIGKVGEKKKIEIVKKAKEKKIKIHNLNIEKFLKNLEKKGIKKKTKEKSKEKPKEKKKETKETKIEKKPEKIKGKEEEK